MRCGGSAVGRTIKKRRVADVGKGSARGIGGVVQEDRHRKFGGDPIGERTRRVDGHGHRFVQGDERHHVERAEPRMDAGMGAEIDRALHPPRQFLEGGEGVSRAGAGQREHGAVMVGVGVEIEQRRPARRAEFVEDPRVSTFRHVGHALQHGLIMGRVCAHRPRRVPF